jgi:hypothetical protein
MLGGSLRGSPNLGLVNLPSAPPFTPIPDSKPQTSWHQSESLLLLQVLHGVIRHSTNLLFQKAPLLP